MWIFSKSGFVSVVEDRNNPNKLWVRSRDRGHLTTLKEQYDLSGTIIGLKNADYRYRLHVTREEWVKVLTSVVEDIDYDNFKSAVGFKEPRYAGALHEVWEVVRHAYDVKVDGE